MTTKLLANGETYIHGLFNNLDVIQASRLLVHKFKSWAVEIGATEAEINCMIYYPAEKEIFMIYSMEEYIGNQQKLLNRIAGMNLEIPVFS